MTGDRASRDAISLPLKLCLLAAIVLLGAFYRLYRIDRLPPGETYDPAYYGLDALAILRGETPIFFETNFGREPLFSYLVAACVAVLGIGPQAIHVASALVGILTIPAVYWLAQELFAGERGLLGRMGSLVAALATGLSFWHLSWSRYGVRAILVPLFSALVSALFWRGMRTKSRWAFAACGALLGLSMYTYQAARFLPLLVLLGFAPALWTHSLRSRRGWLDLGLLIAAALLVFAPLGLYSLTHLDSFTERIDQVFVFGGSEDGKLTAFSRELVKTIGVFGFRGDDKPTINIPGRPALNPYLYAAFSLGIAISLYKIAKPRSFYLLAWLGVMSLPGVLAQGGPTAKRIIGTLPAVAALIAVGALVPLDVLRRWATGRSSVWPRVLTLLLVAVVVGGFVYSGVRTYRDYFVVWGQDPALFTHFEAGLTAIGQYIAGRPLTEQIYVSPVHIGHPSIRYNSRERPGIKGYHGDYCVVLPVGSSRDTTYIVVPGEDERSTNLLPTYLPQGQFEEAGPLHYGQPYFVTYHVPAGSIARIEPVHALQAYWEGIELLGYDWEPVALRAGETLHLALYYRARTPIDADYTVFVQLVGPHNPSTDSSLWSQFDSEPCRRYRPTSTWSVEEVLVDDLKLAIPAESPEGEYRLIMGFYDWGTGERLPVLDDAGQLAADHVVLKELQVTQ